MEEERIQFRQRISEEKIPFGRYALKRKDKKNKKRDNFTRTGYSNELT